MKIKGKLIIPLIAILIAMFTVGVIPGVASDTTATELSDTLTFVPPTPPATSSLEEEVEVMVSDLLGDELESAEGPLRGFSTVMEGLLSSLRNILNSFIKIFEGFGGMLGNTDGLFDGLLGGGSIF